MMNLFTKTAIAVMMSSLPAVSMSAVSIVPQPNTIIETEDVFRFQDNNIIKVHAENKILKPLVSALTVKCCRNPGNQEYFGQAGC